MLALLGIALLCLAGGVELWWNATARQRQRVAARHTEARLAPTPAATGTPSGIVTPASQAQATRAAPASAAVAKLPGWRAALRRAQLPDRPATIILIATPGVLLALACGMRMHSFVFALLGLVLYAIGAAVLLRRRMERQQRQLLRQLPDFLENMVRLAGIGNSLSMAFQTATQQVPPPLRPLLENALLYTRGGMDLDRALQQASRPYKLAAMETLSVVLGTSLRIGGRSDQILQRMSDFLRDVEQVQQELAATTSETRLSAWVIGLLPPVTALGMALFSPDFFRPMVELPAGHALLWVALALEGLGAFLLYRLAKSL
ncbi:pilus assembly protein [Stenotrophomonas panacihumi]|nr:pilus assembly protein [Stenotrophomonas panacihumi]